jgi:signal transduction histidine kinase/ActR/RegA family two-component response regulator
VLLYNDAYAHSLDADKHRNALGRPAREVWPEIWEHVAPAYAALLAGGPADFTENAPFVIRLNGALQEMFWTYSRSPIRDADGAVVGIHAVGVETTARVRAEAERDRLLADERRARKRAEALQALAAELARAATPEEVANAVVTLATAATGTQFGLLLLLDAEGRTFTIAAAPGAPADLMEAWRHFPNAGEIPAAVAARTRQPCYSRSRAEYVARSPGLDVIAETFALEAEAALPLVVDDRVVGVLSFEFDAPRDFDAEEDAHLRALADLCAPALERARLVEAERARITAESARAEAEAANHAKDDLLAVVSHELRAPLAPMRAIAQALRRTAVPMSEVREMAAEIDRLIVYEARLIDDLLDYQRASRGLLTLQYERCNLHEIARKALRVVAPLYRAMQMALTDELAAADPVVWAEPMRVQQIIYNLLANAVKFSPIGARVVLRAWNPAPDSVLLEVVDHGDGIAPDVLERLFEPFTQAAPQRRPNSGLGLGLALSRRLAELHGGTLSAASEGEGRGATFTLRLRTARAVQPVPDENARPIEAHRADAGAHDVVDGPVDSFGEGPVDADGDAVKDRSLRILVIDDDLSTARALQRRLLLEGHVVHVAYTLATAEQIAGAEPLDVVLADLQLGMESGLAAPHRLAEAARREGRAIPAAIVLSGYDRDSDVAQSRAAGFVEHLAKPVDDKALLIAVQRAADSRSRDGAVGGEVNAPESGSSLPIPAQPG